MRSEGTAHQIWKRREFCIKQCWYMTCQMLFRRAPSSGRGSRAQLGGWPARCVISPLREANISLCSKWCLTGFSRRFAPKNPVRLHTPPLRGTAFQRKAGERAYKGNILIPSHFFPFFIFFFECDLDFADALVFFSRFSGEWISPMMKSTSRRSLSALTRVTRTGIPME